MRAEYSAVRAQINGDAALAGKGFDTARVDSTGLPVRDTYWILYGGSPDELDDGRLTSVQSPDSDAEYLYTVRMVSVTTDGVLAGAEKIIGRLVGWAPTVPGRNCPPMILDTDDPQVDADTRVNPPLMFMDLDFILKSNRA